MLTDFGDYELLEEIGRGGQGVVYRARQKSLNRTVALKVIGLGRWATEAHLKRFRREAEAAARLDHPCIVPIHEVGERDGFCYFSMNLVEGRQLDEVVGSATADSSCGECEPLPLRRAVELIAKLAHAVHYAHEHGILHRDIKPGNILLDANGEPHLTDFGLARLMEVDSTITGTREVLGTPSYIAPEQAVGETRPLTGATDVYGLGTVFYQLLTSRPPFVGGTTYETVRLVLEANPQRPRLWNSKIDRELETICLKCLEKGPQLRYHSALALAEDLEHWLRREPIEAKRAEFVAHRRKWVQRNPVRAALGVSLIVLVAIVGWDIWKSPLVGRPAAKSIAVLPFGNLSSNPDNAYFADGVHDEILTHLASIADLKVIGRTSVMQYKRRIYRDLRKIGHELGVANVLQGTVQRLENRVRINAQLIDVRTERQLWARSYDRDLADVFTIQSEIARSIASQLQAKLSSLEQEAINRSPTRDITAFELYAQAKNVLAIKNARENLLQAVELLNQAVVRDPSFSQAYCELAQTHDRLYFLGYDHTPGRLALAEAAINSAFRIRPDAGEARLARAQNLYRGYLDFDAALGELEAVRRALPNNPAVFELRGYIQRRQGKQEEAVRSLERAIELDPRNTFTLQQISLSYHHLRRYADETSVLERALAIEPNDVETKVARAFVDFHWKADTRLLHQTLDSIRATGAGIAQTVADDSLICALAERDAAAAKDAVIAAGANPPFADEAVNFSRPFVEGILALMTKNDEKVRAAFTAARAEQEKMIQVQPHYGPPLCVLGLIDAALGRKEQALREGRKAVELLPVQKDAINGVAMIKYLAMIAAWTGNKELACEQLAIAIRPPSRLTYGQLKLLPFWDPLRGDPCFEKIVASLAPK
ncbi:MAG: protein kinase [Candidatus Acidiferrum sp.]